ncbi:ATP-binding protein [Streptomyces sp. NPDC020794]|uniref:ATP-binding protein n=1 Tax=Streptomyces sp. NPDC020794 TaxID=3365090 RepID=UPI00378C81CF
MALRLARTHTLGDRQVATWAVDADPAEVARARASVSEQLTTWGLEELDFTTELVVSELVTNAIRYGRPPIQLRLIHDRTLMCEVADAGSTTPQRWTRRVFLGSYEHHLARPAETIARFLGSFDWLTMQHLSRTPERGRGVT